MMSQHAYLTHKMVIFVMQELSISLPELNAHNSPASVRRRPPFSNISEIAWPLGQLKPNFMGYGVRSSIFHLSLVLLCILSYSIFFGIFAEFRQSFRQSVFSAKCLFGEVSFRQSGFRRSVVHRFSTAEMSDDCVSKFASLVCSRD